ncbi:MAG: hypothetical protein ABIQ40_14105 [Bacteroidia bacterium]
MAEVGYFLFFLATWFVIPYLLGRLLFKFLKKRWKIVGKDKGAMKFINYGVFLLCALIGWLFEMLVLTGIKLML